MFLENQYGESRLKHLDDILGWVAIAFVAALVLLFAGLSNHASAAGSKPRPEIHAGLVRPNGVNMGSLLLPSTETGYYVEAPRLKTDVKVDISGPVARVKVTQRFVNPGKGWVEGTYVFPLPEDSAVDTLKMQVGDRFIEGQIKPQQEARKIYEKAKAAGKKAALLEQQRPNIFTNQVANIGPNETIVVQIEYQQTVYQADGLFSFRFPMVVAPRYSPAPVIQNVDLDSRTGFATPEDGALPPKGTPEAPVLDPRENAKINPVTLTVNLEAGFPLGEVSSPFHKISMTSPDLDSKVITLQTDEIPADRDFELNWKAAPGKTPNAGLFRETVGNKDYFLAFVTPASLRGENTQPPKRETVFVIDNSGSMGGPSITQAKKSLELAVQNLKPDDRFNIIRFDDTLTVYFDGLQPATKSNKAEAISYVRSLEANGGTEMMPALKAALRDQGPVAPGALRQVVFLTDGAISNEADLFQEIAAHRGHARVFTVGIGSAPNGYFMAKAAETGRGAYTHIGSESQVASRMGALFAKLENPAMTDISAHMDNGIRVSFSPDPIPDLYNGDPIVLTAAVDKGTAKGMLTIEGTADNQPWRANLDLSKAAEGHGLGKLWARRKIDDLEATVYQATDPAMIDKAIEKLALDLHLVSRMTSLVAVDVTPSRPKGQKLDETTLPLNLPEGWDFEKVYGEKPVPGQSIDMQKADAMQTNSLVMATARRYLAAAPTPKVASMMAAQAKGITLPQTATPAGRNILIGLMLLGFAAMGGSLLLLSRGMLGGNLPRKWRRND